MFVLLNHQKLFVDFMLKFLYSIIKHVCGSIGQIASFSGIEGFDGERIFGCGAWRVLGGPREGLFIVLRVDEGEFDFEMEFGGLFFEKGVFKLL